MKKIIINADDFAMAESCTLAICEAFRRGLITDTSMTANGDAEELALQLIRENELLKDRIGIHFQLSEGVPLTPEMRENRKFVTDGRFNAYFRSNLHYFVPLSPKDRRAIHGELTAQVQKLRSLGIPITHADSHFHVHYNWQLAPIFVQVCRENRIRKMRINKNVEDRGWLRNFLFRSYNGYLKRRIPITVDHFEDACRYTVIPEGISEIMVHPDFDRDGMLINRKTRISKGGMSYGAQGDALEKDLARILSGEEEKISYRSLSRS